MTSKNLTRIDATLTFGDGETVQILLALDADSAWGNTEEILWRSVPVREAIVRALIDEELLVEDNEDDEEEED